MARIISFFGGEVDMSVKEFRNKAIEMSSIMGPSTRSVCKELEEETEKIIL